MRVFIGRAYKVAYHAATSFELLGYGHVSQPMGGKEDTIESLGRLLISSRVVGNNFRSI
jgi:hypothetical protein